MSPFAADLLAVVNRSALLLWGLLPYVLAGAALGAVLLRWKHAILPARLAGLPFPLLLAASSVLGSVSPLCTMGAVPVVAGMVGGGFPVGAGAAFLAASSLVNPQMFFIAWGTIGPRLALAQWGCAVGMGCVAGLAAQGAVRQGWTVVNPGALDNPDAKGHHPKHHHKHARRLKTLRVHFLDQLQHVLLYLVFGVVAGAAVSVWAPDSLFLGAIERYGALEVAAGAAASVPMYACGGGVLPVLAQLMAKGLSPGVVLAFVIAGPATRLQALAAVGAFVNKPALVAYALLVWTWAVLAGLAANAIFL